MGLRVGKETENKCAPMALAFFAACSDEKSAGNTGLLTPLCKDNDSHPLSHSFSKHVQTAFFPRSGISNCNVTKKMNDCFSRPAPWLSPHWLISLVDSATCELK